MPWGTLALDRSARDDRSGGQMLTLTSAAAGKVKELLVEEGRDDIALRVAVQPAMGIV